MSGCSELSGSKTRFDGCETHADMSGCSELSGSKTHFDGCETLVDHLDPATMDAGGGPPRKNGWTMGDLGGIGVGSSGSLSQMIWRHQEVFHQAREHTGQM